MILELGKLIGQLNIGRAEKERGLMQGSQIDVRLVQRSKWSRSGSRSPCGGGGEVRGCSLGSIPAPTRVLRAAELLFILSNGGHSKVVFAQWFGVPTITTIKIQQKQEHLRIPV